MFDYNNCNASIVYLTPVMIRTLAFVYIFASLAFALKSPKNLLLKAYIPNRCNPCDSFAACTQYPLPLKPTPEQCEAALGAVLFQPTSIAAQVVETKGRAIFDPVFQWFANGPLVTSQQFASYTGVGVYVSDAFGLIVASVAADGTVSSAAVGLPTPYFNTMRARSTNIPTYLRQDLDGMFYYSVNIYNWDDQMYTVTIYVPIANLPVV